MAINAISDKNDISKTNKDEIDNCKALIKDLQQALKVKDERIDEVSQHIHFLETGIPSQNNKRKLDSLGEIDEEMIKDTYSKDLKIQNLLKDNEDLKAKLNMKRSDESKAKENMPQATELKQNLQETQGEYKDKREEDKPDQLIQMVEKKLTHGLHTIQSNMEKLINAKLGQKVGIKNYAISELENANTTSKTTNDTTSSYAAAVGKSGDNISGDFCAIILTAKNKELAEEADRKRCAANLIIHGKGKEAPPNEDKKIYQWPNNKPTNWSY